MQESFGRNSPSKWNLRSLLVGARPTALPVCLGVFKRRRLASSVQVCVLHDVCLFATYLTVDFLDWARS
jgi:hypothetical protein